jgi:hypothetical protein
VEPLERGVLAVGRLVPVVEVPPRVDEVVALDPRAVVEHPLGEGTPVDADLRHRADRLLLHEVDPEVRSGGCLGQGPDRGLVERHGVSFR